MLAAMRTQNTTIPILFIFSSYYCSCYQASAWAYFTSFFKKCKLAINELGQLSFEIVIADPAKNITIFVHDRLDSKPERTEAAKLLLADPSLKAEQVGFVIPPAGNQKYWRLEMMGSEFCGNAARKAADFRDGEYRCDAA
jgi:hypothetical protein